jgi:hypothetical protein
VDFTSLGTFQAPGLFLDGLHIIGSGDLTVSRFNGLGVKGGLDAWLDGDEFILFQFDPAPVFNVSYEVIAAGDQNWNGQLGESFIEAFGPGGQSLGLQPTFDGGLKELSAFFTPAPLSAFRVIANSDNLRISSVTFTPVPEPGPLLLVSLSLLGMACAAGRRRWKRLSSPGLLIESATGQRTPPD